jgi:cyclic dehypoxanthinyl futalosine synthase
MPTRMTTAEALDLYRHASLHELGSLAHAVTLARHPQPERTYIVDRNINYSNVCTAGCAFCNFKVPPGDGRGYVLATDTLLAKIDELLAIGGTQVLLQGGLHPDLPLGWYEDLLRTIKSHAPSIHLHAFSPPEIVHLARLSGLSVRDVLARLIAAGLDSLPGGGAEILVDRVRRAISPGKCSTDEWLDVIRQAHSLGLRTSATMMFGHIETDEERIEHLARVRQLQDETGGFIAFIPWTFQHERTELAKTQTLQLASAVEYLRTLAISRLFLDNVDNLQASWVTQGEKIGQLALFFGANDMGSMMMEENVVSSAGTIHRLDERAIRHLITAAGFTPRRRNQRYDLL